MLIQGSELLLLGLWLWRRMMPFVLFFLLRLPVALVPQLQSRRHWPVRFDFEWTLALALPG
jgi:hypothetical protein